MAQKSPNFIFTTKMVFPKSLKFMNSGSQLWGYPKQFQSPGKQPPAAFHAVWLLGDREAVADSSCCIVLLRLDTPLVDDPHFRGSLGEGGGM